MILHKIVDSADAGEYLPFGLSRLRALESIWGTTGFFQEKYEIDGFRIEVQQSPPFQYVRITGGRLGYEFFTSEHVSDTEYGTPGFIGGLYDTFVAGSATRATFTKNKSKASPRYSTEFAPGEDDPWRLLPVDHAQTADTRLKSWRSWQNQKFFEHAWHAKNGRELVTSTQAQAPGLGNQCGWMSPYAFARIGAVGSKTSDYGLDVYPTLYSAGGKSVGAPQLDQPWQYWRHAAVQSTPDGRFFISTDNYGRFQVYRVADYSDTQHIVPASAYRVYTPPYPSWVTVPDSNDYRWQVNHWLWRFNKDATKCAAIAFHSEFPPGFYKYINGLNFFATLVDGQAASATPAGAVIPAREDTPGLIEFGIAIEVTGPGARDFNVTFTPLRSSYFGADHRFFFDAAYFLSDVENIGIAEDTLMTAEVECLYPAGYYQAFSSETPSPFAQDSIQGTKADIVINANTATMVRAEQLRFPILSPVRIRFPTVAGRLAQLNNELGGLNGGLIGGDVGGIGLVPSAGPISLVLDIVSGLPIETNRGGTLANLYAMELSTLSILYEVDNTLTGFGYVRAMAYGTEFYRRDYSIGFTQPPSSLPPATLPVSSVRVYQYILDSVLNTEVGMGFSVHPAGHWALSVNANLQQIGYADDLDWISVKEKDVDGVSTRSKYTHRDLFNSAFKQTRAYSFYTESYPGRALWDQGSFKTAGFWLTV